MRKETKEADEREEERTENVHPSPGYHVTAA
jgi:hypothetical protein